MAGSGVHVHCAVAVVFGTLVLILDDQPNRRTEGDAKLGARLDLHTIFLVSGGCESALAGAAPGHLRLDVGFCKFHARGAAIDNTANGTAM